MGGMDDNPYKSPPEIEAEATPKPQLTRMEVAVLAISSTLFLIMVVLTFVAGYFNIPWTSRR